MTWVNSTRIPQMSLRPFVRSFHRGAVAVLRHARNRATKDAEWVRALLARSPAKVVAVELANRTARIAWAVMARGEAYRAKEIAGQAA